MNIKMKQVLACALAVAIAVLVTACGSSDSDSTGAGTSAADATTGSTPEPTGEPIKLGHISDIESEGVIQRSTPASIEAAIAEINSEGGIDGRPLELTICNSERNPNTVRACARKAVDDGVVAFVGNVSSADEGFVPVLDQAKVPAIGTVPLSPVAGESSSAFCFNGGLASAIVGLPGALKTAGAKDVTFLYPSNVGSASAGMKEAWEFGVEASGLEDAGAVGFALGETQFDAPVAKAVGGDAEGVALLVPGEAQATLIQTVLQQAPDVHIATVNSLMTPSVLDALGASADGISAVAITQPASAEEVPGIAKYNASMDAFDPDGEYERRDLGINGWASVWAFQKVVSDLPEITRENVFKAMENQKDLDLGGIFPPLSSANRGNNPPGLQCAMAIGDVVVDVEDGETFAVEPGKFFEPFAG